MRALWRNWKSALTIVKPDTVVRWHRKGFSSFLDLEDSPRQAREAGGAERGSGSDPDGRFTKHDYVIQTFSADRADYPVDIRSLPRTPWRRKRWRTHLSLDKDAPQSRRRQHPAEGPVIEIPEVGGLHHHYERRAA